MRWHYENWYGRASKSYMQGQQDDSASKITCFSKFNSKNPLTSESLASNVHEHRQTIIIIQIQH